MANIVNVTVLLHGKQLVMPDGVVNLGIANILPREFSLRVLHRGGGGQIKISSPNAMLGFGFKDLILKDIGDWAHLTPNVGSNEWVAEYFVRSSLTYTPPPTPAPTPGPTPGPTPAPTPAPTPTPTQAPAGTQVVKSFGGTVLGYGWPTGSGKSINVLNAFGTFLYSADPAGFSEITVTSAFELPLYALDDGAPSGLVAVTNFDGTQIVAFGRELGTRVTRIANAFGVEIMSVDAPGVGPIDIVSVFGSSMYSLNGP